MLPVVTMSESHVLVMVVGAVRSAESWKGRSWSPLCCTLDVDSDTTSISPGAGISNHPSVALMVDRMLSWLITGLN